MVRNLKCWNCGCKQPMPTLEEVICHSCNELNIYVPTNMRGGKMAK